MVTRMSEPPSLAPLNLAGMGSFHVGGRMVELRGQPMRSAQVTSAATLAWDPNGHYPVEQAYVQWFRPAGTTARPVLLVHGGGMTGSTWETTPDGRPGWQELLLRHGLPVYVLDNAERGRAGWCALPGIWPDAPIARSLEWAWELFRFGPPAGFPDRPFPGQRFPVGHLPAFGRSFVPRWVSTTAAQIAAVVAAIDRIGPLDLVCHSQGGEVALQAAAARPDAVRRIVALEPSGFTDRLHPGQRLLTVIGDYWQCSPAAEAREAQIRAFAAQGELWDMTARGAAGHSHMLMMDHGSEALAGALADWLLQGG